MKDDVNNEMPNKTPKTLIDFTIYYDLPKF